jgi:hypothetical protein
MALQEADQWRLTATLTLTGDDTTAITANLERNEYVASLSTASGSGMTPSYSARAWFTFPWNRNL